MAIRGTEGLTDEQIRTEIAAGGRFVHYLYCISVVFMTFRRPSPLYFLRAGESSVGRGLPYSALAFFLGWWGIPWGPIWTIQSLWANFSGGKDVTNAVLAHAANAAATAIPRSQHG